MNKKQLFCLWCGIAVFVFIGLINSDNYTFRYFLPLLIVYWPIVAIITGSLIYTFKDRKRPESDNIKPLDLRRGFKRVSILFGIICGGTAIGISIYIRSSALSNLGECELAFMTSIPVAGPNDRPPGWPKWSEEEVDSYFDRLSSWLVVKNANLPLISGEEDKKFREEHNIPPDSTERFYTAESMKFINTYGKCVEKARLLLHAQSFWSSISTSEFILALILIGSGSTIIGFCFTWFVYSIIRWLVVGFQR